MVKKNERRNHLLFFLSERINKTTKLKLLAFGREKEKKLTLFGLLLAFSCFLNHNKIGSSYS